MHTSLRKHLATALFLAGALAMAPVHADKPEGAGGGKSWKAGKDRHNDDERGERREGDRGDKRESREQRYFDDRHRAAVHEYYDDRFRHGRCPPGLAKKHNGCLPPGQAKKWQVGQPLPRDVVYYPLPRAVVIKLGTPPAGHKFVRVASDILLIAVGTGMVIDAIDDLSRQ